MSASVDERLELNYRTFSRTGDGIAIGIVYHGLCRNYLVTYYELDGKNLIELEHLESTSSQITVHREDIFRIVAGNAEMTCSDILSQRTVYNVERNGTYVSTYFFYIATVEHTQFEHTGPVY